MLRLAIICSSTIFFALAPSGAWAQSPTAGRPAYQSGCSVAQVHVARSLASAKKSRVQRLCKEAAVHASKVRFWHQPSYIWTLYMHYQHYNCAQLRAKHLLKGPEKLCVKARAEVRIHSAKLTKLNAKIKSLLPQPHLVHDRLYQSFACIHRGEGAWNAIGYFHGVATYFGGLQMDLNFMKAYGPEFLAKWGTADKWPPWAQMKAAERGYASGSGFGPWPKTAPACGFSTAAVTPISLEV